MYQVLLVVYLLAAMALIGLVLVQQGKGADMGASFGAGASNTVFGASGSGNFLTKMTSLFAIVFFVISLVLSNLNNTANETQDAGWENLEQPVAEQQAIESTTPAEDKAVQEEQIPE